MSRGKTVQKRALLVAAAYLGFISLFMGSSILSRSLAEDEDSVTRALPAITRKALNEVPADIFFMVMGESKTFRSWLRRFEQVDSPSLTFLYGSNDEEIHADECDNDYGLNCGTIFMPGTTWSEGRNLMAAEALRREKVRGKEYDYWVFIDDDLDVTCAEQETEGVEEVLGDGSCWQKVINFISSDQVPENASSLTIPVSTTGKHGFSAVSTSGSVFGAFKRERVPYLLPYATLDEGVSQWLSQAAMFCIMRTCMKDSSVVIPFVGGENGVHHGYDRDLIEADTIKSTIVSNFHDDSADFHPCQDVSLGQYLQQLQHSTGLTVSGEALATRIPVPKLSYCEPLKARFIAFENQIS